MPELPDVEVFKHYLDTTSLHQRIAQISILHTKIVRSISNATFSRKLKERQLEESHRHGKVLFAKLNGGHGWVWFHFGMTGFLTYGNGEEKDVEDHVRLLLKFSNGHCLRFHCPRLFGQVGWIGGVDEYLQRHTLGPDALTISEPVFLQRVQNTRRLLKPMLMNQSVIAGIGNVYSDEILFQARLHPLTPVHALKNTGLRRIHRTMQTVLKKAIRYQADPQNMPQTWLLRHRRSQTECPRCGGKIFRVTVQQRSSYFCEACQSKPV